MKWIRLRKQEFVSSCYETKQFRAFFNLAKKEIKALLKDRVKEFVMNKGHFDFFGFFEMLDNRIYYFSIADVRYFPKDDLLIRTAKDFKDYTGGSNQYVTINENFSSNLLSFLNL